MGKTQEYLAKHKPSLVYGPTASNLPSSTASSTVSASHLSPQAESAFIDAADVIAEMDNVDINKITDILAQSDGSPTGDDETNSSDQPEDLAPVPMLGVEDVVTLDLHHYSKDSMLDLGIDHHMVSQCQGQDVLNNTSPDTPLFIASLNESEQVTQLSQPLYLAVDNSTPLHIVNTKVERPGKTTPKTTRAKPTNYAKAIAQLSTEPMDELTPNDRLKAVLYSGFNVRKHCNITAGLEYIKEQNRLSEENCPIMQFCRRNKDERLPSNTNHENITSPECIVIDDDSNKGISSPKKVVHTKIKIKRKVGSDYEAQIVNECLSTTDRSRAKCKKAKKSKFHAHKY